MENELKMYSNTTFASILKDLINDSGYSSKEIEKEMKASFGTTISYKQIDKYISGTAIPKADSLYLLANFFQIPIDALVGRCELDSFYFSKNELNKNKFHLNSDSKRILSNMENETQIDVINNIISSSSLLETFVTQIETASAQIKNTQDKETKENITYIASCMVQREIDKLFRKYIKKYLKM